MELLNDFRFKIKAREKIAKKVLAVLVIGIIVGISLGIFVARINSPSNPTDNRERLFSVKKGEGLWAIASNLEKEKLVENRLFFDAAVFFLNGARRLQAGDYYLSASLTPREIAQKIIAGEVAKEIITIPEGWSLAEIKAHLKNRGLFSKQELYRAANKDFSLEFSFLKDRPKSAGLEGYLFPDTYEFIKKEGIEALIKKVLENFDKKLTADLRSEIRKQNKTIFEIITMASLLEKEVKIKEDKELAAGVLWKRLKIGMKLQIDASAKYDPLYDTYKFGGLPPGPIANPGLESIMAAIYPQKSDYWYYLSAPDGKTIFSRTFDEHLRAKVKYLAP